MARYQVRTTARHPNGTPAPLHTLTFYTDSGALTLATLYAAEVGGGTVANPYTTNASAIVDFWTEDTTIWVLASGDSSVRPVNINISSGVPSFNVKDYGATGDGGTDDYAAIVDALDDVYAAGGGQLYFPAGVYRINSVLRMPDDGEAIPTGVPITLMGSGAIRTPYANGLSVAPNASVIDLRVNSAPAKLETRGWGRLTMRDLTFTNLGAADTNPFVQTTLTTLDIKRCAFWGHASKHEATCNQDAIVLGGAPASFTLDGSDNASFCGYGTVIESNFFSGIQRGVYGRSAANACIVRGNEWSGTCGSIDDSPAIEFDGTGDQACFNTIQDNIIEVPHYNYGITFRNSASNVCINNGFWDGTPTACYRLVGASGNQTIIGGIVPIDPANWIEANGNAYHFQRGYMSYGLTQFGSRPVLIQPDQAVDNDALHLFRICKSLNDSVDPGETLFNIDGHGTISLGGEYPGVAAGTCGLGSTGVAQSSGVLELYAGSGSTVTIMRGTFKLSSTAAGSRPDPGVVGEAAMAWDNGLNKPIFSTGAKWVLADGTDV